MAAIPAAPMPPVLMLPDEVTVTAPLALALAWA
jgi:hypothetical protein